MIRWALASSILVALWATPSFAQEWRRCGDTHKSDTDSAPVTGVEPDASVCYDFDDDTDSELLAVGQCENFDIIFNPDFTGSDTDAEVAIRSCVTRAANTNACWIIENDTLDGDPTDADADPEAIYGAAAVWIYVDVTTTAGGDDARVLVHCNE